MNALEKIQKIEDLKLKLENWETFHFKIERLIQDKDRARKNYRGLIHHLRLFLNLKPQNQFELTSLNDDLGLLQVNLDYSKQMIEKVKQEIISI